MLDGTEFFECACGGDEHTLRFIVDTKDKELYASVYLNNYRSIWQRVWVAVKYVFGYKCKYGHWDNWILNPEDAVRLKQMLERMEEDGAGWPVAEKKSFEETTEILQQAASEASALAIKQAFDAGRDITVIENKQIVSITPEGVRTVLKDLRCP